VGGSTLKIKRNQVSAKRQKKAVKRQISSARRPAHKTGIRASYTLKSRREILRMSEAASKGESKEGALESQYRVGGACSRR